MPPGHDVVFFVTPSCAAVPRRRDVSERTCSWVRRRPDSGRVWSARGDLSEGSPAAADGTREAAGSTPRAARRSRRAGRPDPRPPSVAADRRGCGARATPRPGCPPAHRFVTTRGSDAARGPLTRERLPQHDADGEDVRALVDLAAGQLLGRHVADGAHHDALDRQRGALGTLRRAQLGEPEIEQLDVQPSRLVGAADDVPICRTASPGGWRVRDPRGCGASSRPPPRRTARGSARQYASDRGAGDRLRARARSAGGCGRGARAAGAPPRAGATPRRRAAAADRGR
jgi:hypothetical protein